MLLLTDHAKRINSAMLISVTPLWSVWQSWQRCSVTCGSGIRRRSRICSNGTGCLGSSSEIEECHFSPCAGAIENLS